MSVVLAIVAIVLSMVLVVGLHEAGHAIMARLFNVKINKISIGFGKALFHWQGKRGYPWVFALWPLGGYVQLLNTRITPVLPEEYPYAFDKKPIWVRCVILLSGALANVFVAWLALVLMLVLGYQQRVPIIQTITTPSIASNAGLVAGDRLVAIDGQPVPSWRDVGMQLVMALGQANVDVVVDSPAGVRHQVTLHLAHWEFNRGHKNLLQAMGVTPDVSPNRIQRVDSLPLLTACHQAFVQLMGLITFFCVMIKQLLTGVIPFVVLLGPLGLFTAMMGSFLQGVAVFLYFIASLSLAVAVINLCPIPGLDGGSIVYALVEKYRKKPVSVAMEILLHRLVFIAFCLVLVHLVLNDVQRYLG